MNSVFCGLDAVKDPISMGAIGLDEDISVGEARARIRGESHGVIANKRYVSGLPFRFQALDTSY
jgi:hypothetical protein